MTLAGFQASMTLEEAQKKAIAHLAGCGKRACLHPSGHGHWLIVAAPPGMEPEEVALSDVLAELAVKA